MQMKKLLLLSILAFTLAFGGTANATLLGTGELKIEWGPPIESNYYLDYDGTVQSSTFGYTTGKEEVFCVSGQSASGAFQPYNFYTITSDLDSVFGSGFFNKMSEAAWIADNWQAQGWAKSEAQKAVWKIMNIPTLKDIAGSGGQDIDIYNLALGHEGYVTGNWYFAYTPLTEGGADYQDFLTHHVPEPSTLLLLGSGLTGLYVMRRRGKK